MPEEDKSLLEVRDLTKRFGAATALDRVSLTLLRGRLNGLAGPDGAGKTTLIRILTGLLGSDSGEIRLDGVSLAEAVARQGFIGYMPQKFGLYEDLSVLENLRLYAALNGVPKEKERGLFDEMLRFTDLARFSERLAGRAKCRCRPDFAPRALEHGRRTDGGRHDRPLVDRLSRRGRTLR